MTARDVIARLLPGARLSEVQDQADNIIQHLHAAGYLILAPAEIEAMKKEAFMAGCKWQSEMGGKEKPDAR